MTPFVSLCLGQRLRFKLTHSRRAQVTLTRPNESEQTNESGRTVKSTVSLSLGTCGAHVFNIFCSFVSLSAFHTFIFRFCFSVFTHIHFNPLQKLDFYLQIIRSYSSVSQDGKSNLHYCRWFHRIKSRISKMCKQRNRERV